VGLVVVMTLIARGRVQQLTEDRGADQAEADYDNWRNHAPIVRLEGLAGKDHFGWRVEEMKARMAEGRPDDIPATETRTAVGRYEVAVREVA